MSSTNQIINTEVKIYDNFNSNLGYGLTELDHVILHFDNISMRVSEHVLATSCPFFHSVFRGDPQGYRPLSYTIQNYSEEAVMTMLRHLYGDGQHFEKSRFWLSLPEEEFDNAFEFLREYFEVFRLADEYDLPKLRSQAQANIMAIRQRAIELKDSLIASMIFHEVISMYNDDWRLDLGMFDDFASQCLEYECVKEDSHFWIFGKVDGVWVAKQEEYQILVKKLNELDTGMAPIPTERFPLKSEAEMWTW